MKKIIQLLCFLSLLPTCNLCSQQIDKAFFDAQKVISSNGIMPSLINMHITDSFGYVWLNTSSGLLRFDGLSFFNVDFGSFKTESRIYDMALLPNDTVCAMSENHFYYFKDNKLVKIGTLEKRLNYVKDKLEKEYFYLSNNFQSKTIWSKTYDFDRAFLWAKDTFITYTDMGFSVFAKNREIYTQNISGFNHLMLMVNDSFIIYYDKANNHITFLDKNLKKTVFVLSTIIPSSRIVKSSSNNILFAVDDRNITKIEFVGNNKIQSTALLLGTSNNKVTFNDAYYFQIVNSKNYVVYTHKNGIFRLTKRIFNLIESSKGDPQYGISVMVDENTFINQWNWFIYPTSGKKSMFHSTLGKGYGASYTNSEGISWYACEDFSPEKYGHILIKSLKNGQGDSIILKLPPANTIDYIFEDANKRLWLSSSSEIGYLSGNQFHKTKNISDFTEAKRIRCMGQYGKDNLLISTLKNTFIYNTKANNLSLIPQLKNIESRYVFDDGSVYFIATYGNGLYYLKNGQLHKFIPDPRGFLKFSHYIINDKNHNYWIATNNGMVFLSAVSCRKYISDSTKVPSFLYFPIKSDVDFVELNGGYEPAFVALKNGNYALPTMQGIYTFCPDSVFDKKLIPAIRVEEIIANGFKIQQIENKIKLPPHVNNLNIILSVLYFADPDNIDVSYTLLKEGNSDTLWNRLFDNKITIPNITNGSYKLVFRMGGSLGDNNYEYYAKEIEIELWWYQTLIFKILLVFTNFALIILLIWYRNRTLVKRSKDLQMQVAVATSQLNSNIQVLNTAISLKDRLFKIIAHDLLGAMNLHKNILHFVNKTDSDVKTLKHTISELSISTESMTIYLDNIVTWARLQDNEDVSVVLSEFNLNSIIRQNLDQFSTTAKLKNIKFTIHGLNDFLIVSDEKIMNIILHNLIANSMKFTQDGIIELFYTKTESRAIITVKDSGKGFSQKIIDLYNNDKIKKIESSAGTQNELGKGLGLLIIKELCAKINATITISNNCDKGACVELELPENAL